MALRIPVHDEDHVQGGATAPITLVEYGDYQCPYCRAAYPVVKALQLQFGKRLRFVFRNFPLTDAHPEALAAAVTAEFGASHQRFWEIHDALYENQEQLGEELYIDIVRRLGLDEAGLLAALESGAYVDRIRRDFDGGLRSGVNGTPSFFINGRRYDGPVEPGAMAASIERD